MQQDDRRPRPRRGKRKPAAGKAAQAAEQLQAESSAIRSVLSRAGYKLRKVASRSRWQIDDNTSLSRDSKGIWHIAPRNPKLEQLVEEALANVTHGN